jgi:hypothetical protein
MAHRLREEAKAAVRAATRAAALAFLTGTESATLIERARIIVMKADARRRMKKAE